jgi:hypothetical protein
MRAPERWGIPQEPQCLNRIRVQQVAGLSGQVTAERQEAREGLTWRHLSDLRPTTDIQEYHNHIFCGLPALLIQAAALFFRVKTLVFVLALWYFENLRHFHLEEYLEGQTPP